MNISSSVAADRRYIAWLALVALAFNYNVWFCTARLAFPYHSPTANTYWVALDLVSDAINLIDICVWQPRLQFVKGGDIIVSPTEDLSRWRWRQCHLCPPPPEDLDTNGVFDVSVPCSRTER